MSRGRGQPVFAIVGMPRPSSRLTRARCGCAEVEDSVSCSVVCCGLFDYWSRAISRGRAGALTGVALRRLGRACVCTLHPFCAHRIVGAMKNDVLLLTGIAVVRVGATPCRLVSIR